MSCWGANGSGRLGDGTLSSRPQPVSVLSLSGAISAAAGTSHTCALLSDGNVSCWGDDSLGQLGLGDLVPTDRNTGGFIVQGISNFSGLAAGGFTTCGISSASVLCWGSNEFGQLGHSGISTPSSSLAVLVRNLPYATKIAVGGQHVCATAGIGVYCWGSNDRGQLGDGTIGGYRADVELVTGLPNRPIVDIVAGNKHTCIVLDDGSARCWGANDQGQLGVGGINDAAQPQPVLR